MIRAYEAQIATRSARADLYYGIGRAWVVADLYYGIGRAWVVSYS